MLGVLHTKKTTKEVPDSKSSSTVVCSNDITTRSDWTFCIFCKKKSYKKEMACFVAVNKCKKV